MGEQVFDAGGGGRAGAGELDYGLLLVELRCRETGWLEARREWLVREQRRLRVEELAVTRVLDERGRIDDRLAQRDGVSVHDVRRTCRTAPNLERQPYVAAAAARGALSGAQLDRISDLVDPDDPASDRRWAAEGPRWSPAALGDELRRTRTPTMAEATARRAARELRVWWRPDRGMLDGRFSLPDVDGALVEGVLNRMIDQMRPANGEAWETRERRGADALVELCRTYASGAASRAASSAACRMIVEVPLDGPATVCGIPLPDPMVEALRAQATIEPVLTNHHSEPVAVGRAEPALSDKTRRVVRQRDGKCRWPERRRRLSFVAVGGIQFVNASGLAQRGVEWVTMHRSSGCPALDGGRTQRPNEPRERPDESR
jgi:hypothetical protein